MRGRMAAGRAWHVVVRVPEAAGWVPHGVHAMDALRGGACRNCELRLSVGPHCRSLAPRWPGLLLPLAAFGSDGVRLEARATGQESFFAYDVVTLSADELLRVRSGHFSWLDGVVHAGAFLPADRGLCLACLGRGGRDDCPQCGAAPVWYPGA